LSAAAIADSRSLCIDFFKRLPESNELREARRLYRVMLSTFDNDLEPGEMLTVNLKPEADALVKCSILVQKKLGLHP